MISSTPPKFSMKRCCRRGERARRFKVRIHVRGTETGSPIRDTGSRVTLVDSSCRWLRTNPLCSRVMPLQKNAFATAAGKGLATPPAPPSGTNASPSGEDSDPTPLTLNTCWTPSTGTRPTTWVTRAASGACWRSPRRCAHSISVKSRGPSTDAIPARKGTSRSCCRPSTPSGSPSWGP